MPATSIPRCASRHNAAEPKAPRPITTTSLRMTSIAADRTPQGCRLPAEQPERASAADRLVPAVHAEPLVQATGSLLGRGPGDAQLVGDDRERHRLREVTQNLGLRSGDRRGPRPGPGLLR